MDTDCCVTETPYIREVEHIRLEIRRLTERGIELNKKLMPFMSAVRPVTCSGEVKDVQPSCVAVVELHELYLFLQDEVDKLQDMVQRLAI
jgi:hypothetical protein